MVVAALALVSGFGFMVMGLGFRVGLLGYEFEFCHSGFELEGIGCGVKSQRESFKI